MSTCLSQRNGTKARKPHYCALCGERINIGDIQDVRTGVSDGQMYTMHMHPECHSYEQKPDTVDPDWYEYCTDPAFTRDAARAALAGKEAKP